MAAHLPAPNYTRDFDRSCTRCFFRKANGRRCKNRTCERFPYCFFHLKDQYGLVVAPTTLPIPGAGKGLFFVGYRRPNGQRKMILYPNVDVVTYYSAPDVETKDDFDARYEGHMEPVYALTTSEDITLDSRNTMNFPGRFINDVYGTNRRANVRFSDEFVWNDEFKRYMLEILPLRRIDARNGPVELFVNYGNLYWDE